MLKTQEVYEKIVTHLVTQGHRAIGDNGRCRYRAPNGDKCAIGCLIPDDVYQPEMETLPVDSIITSLSPEYQKTFCNDKNAEIMCELQALHDVYMYWTRKEDFIEHVKLIGKDAKLDISFIDSLDWSNFGK